MNLNDAATYIGPPPESITIAPNYPIWMYHPTLPAVIVMSLPDQIALVATDSRWTP